MNFKKDRLFLTRLLTGILVPIAVLAGIFILYFHGSPFKCMFYEVTGLYCPGCGSGRAATAIVHLNFRQALRYNPFFVFLGLPAFAYCFLAYFQFVFNIKILPEKSLPTWFMIFLTVIILLFWVLRNINIYPFVLLAPG
jgi:hypothetical protein